MAICAMYDTTEIYRDDAVIISKDVMTSGRIMALRVGSVYDSECDTMKLTQLSETEYSPRSSYKGTYFSTVCTLYHYREKLKEITGIDFFAGIHVEDMEQSKAQ